jgi:hypothetical protein
MDLARATFARGPRRAPLTARKKGSGYEKVYVYLPRPSSLQLGIEISGKTMGARGLMGMR